MQIEPHIEPVEPRRLLTADLVISKITLNTTFAGLGHSVSYQVEVKNLSNEPWTNSGLGEGVAVLTLDSSIGNSDDIPLLGAFNVGIINAGAKRTITGSGTIGTSFSAGDYKLAVKINTSDSIQTNNTTLNPDSEIELIGQNLINTTITGTNDRDIITFDATGTHWRAVINGVSSLVPDAMDELTINAQAGPDKITIAQNTTRDIQFTINGYGGNDVIQSGDADDRINGMNGSDTIRGGAGNDYILGGANADRLYGEDDNDTLSGGGSNDKLYGGKGNDRLLGGDGNDYFDTRELGFFTDLISGNRGDDLADVDDDDVATSTAIVE